MSTNSLVINDGNDDLLKCIFWTPLSYILLHSSNVESDERTIGIVGCAYSAWKMYYTLTFITIRWPAFTLQNDSIFL